ncbi:hypothetical protein V492_08028, partial [Pseudogymnoascus sp. VKM F-4246]
LQLALRPPRNNPSPLPPRRSRHLGASGPPPRISHPAQLARATDPRIRAQQPVDLAPLSQLGGVGAHREREAHQVPRLLLLQPPLHRVRHALPARINQHPHVPPPNSA